MPTSASWFCLKTIIALRIFFLELENFYLQVSYIKSQRTTMTMLFDFDFDSWEQGPEIAFPKVNSEKHQSQERLCEDKNVL